MLLLLFPQTVPLYLAGRAAIHQFRPDWDGVTRTRKRQLYSFCHLLIVLRPPAAVGLDPVAGGLPLEGSYSTGRLLGASISSTISRITFMPLWHLARGADKDGPGPSWIWIQRPAADACSSCPGRSGGQEVFDS